jgi:hypothetical protein
MGKLVSSLLICFCVGCAHTPSQSEDPSDAAASGEIERPAPECRYMSVWIDYSQDATGMTAKDVKLNEKIAHWMEHELSESGYRISDDPSTAYWSLMIMGAHTGYRDQFVFTAMLSLRNLEEGRGSGMTGYSKGDEASPPTMYTGLSYGARRELRRLVREYIRAADAALLPVTRRMCDFDAAEQNREQNLELQIPGFMYES